MNNALNQLQPYPFEKLRALLGSVTPNPDKRPIALSIGEPKHTSPAFVAEALSHNLDQMAVYPTTLGIPALREAIGAWCERRFNVPKGWLDPARNILPVNGTREALFAFTQTVVNRGDDALVVSPNPFYQIYEGAAFLAGAKPHYLPCLDSNGFNPDFDAVSPDIWKRCQILFLCSPGNPTGALIPVDTLKKLIALADEYDFVIAADECYSELYFDEQTPPPGLLSACVELDREDFKRCVVFPQPVQALQPARPALRLRGRRRRDPQGLPAVPHLPRLRDARTNPAWPASPPGRTRPTYWPTATCTARNSTPCWRS